MYPSGFFWDCYGEELSPTCSSVALGDATSAGADADVQSRCVDVFTATEYSQCERRLHEHGHERWQQHLPTRRDDDSEQIFRSALLRHCRHRSPSEVTVCCRCSPVGESRASAVRRRREYNSGISPVTSDLLKHKKMTGLFHRGQLAVTLALATFLHLYVSVQGDRAGDALFLDGGQEPFNSTDPPSPGFVYLTPRKTSRGLPPWFEFSKSFTVQLWIRPKRIFIGTEVEGGIVGCLVRNTFGTQRAGYGLTITSDSLVHFTLTVDVLTATLDYEVEIEKWVQLTVQYDHELVLASMWASFGDGNAPILVAQNQFQYIGPKSVNYWIHNDLLLGLFQPLYDPPFYYSGYIDELRFWSRTMDVTEMTDALYRGYNPVSDYLQGIGMKGYYPMDAVTCTDELCSGVVGMQQWIHSGRDSRFTSSLVLYASPLDKSEAVADIDCRFKDMSSSIRACICHEFTADYCWDEIKQEPVYCAKCELNVDPNVKVTDGGHPLFNTQKEFVSCHRVACYGPFGAPKCLQPVLVNGSRPEENVQYEIEINTCIDGNDVQKWTKGQPGTYYQLMSAANTIMCLSTQQKGPFRGSPVFLEKCTFQQDELGGTLPPPEHQAWSVDSHTLSLKNKLSGFCVSSSSLENAAQPYLIDCVSLDILDKATPVMNFLFDWAGGRSGVLIGGAYLTSSVEVGRCDGKTLCDPTVKPPIEQKPIITHVNGQPLTQYQMQMEAFADNKFVLTVTARDPNLNDNIQIDFSPFDIVLQTHESVEWPYAFVCEGGPRDTLNCTCNDFACTSPTVCPFGTCIRNQLNSCPSNPCTRTFIWTPIPFTEFLNPATLIFIARDIPINELPGPAAAAQKDTPLQIVTTVRMPPQFEPPTPYYNCKGGTLDGTQYKSLLGCQTTCEAQGSGKCVPTRYEVAIGSTVCFTVRAISLEPESTIRILFLSEGTSFISPPEARVTISSTLPTPVLVESNGVLVEKLVMNPVERNWCFTPNSVDARRLYQSCFVAYNPARGLVPSATTAVYCVEIFVLPTNPLFENPSPTNNTVLEGYVGCNFQFHMAALKNDTATYVLMVYPTETFYFAFNGTRNLQPGLPKGSIWANEQSTDATQVYTFNWTPEEGQEGNWQICFATQDSLSVSMESRCVFLNVKRCLRCIRTGDQLESIGQLYNAHWLELYAVNPALHSNPAVLKPGMLINTGVVYRSPRLQPLKVLSKYLHTTPSALRRLNPDITSDDEMIEAFAKLCVMPETCGQPCGDAAYCDRRSAIDGKGYHDVVV